MAPKVKRNKPVKDGEVTVIKPQALADAGVVMDLVTHLVGSMQEYMAMHPNLPVLDLFTGVYVFAVHMFKNFEDSQEMTPADKKLYRQGIIDKLKREFDRKEE
jgi:hypothetical protein